MRRRADTPPGGPTTQAEPHPPKRARRESDSPSLSPSESSARYMRTNPNPSGTSPRIIRGSPTPRGLPPLHPLPHSQQGGAGPSTYQSFSAAGAEVERGTSSSQPVPQRSSNWPPTWPPGHMARHSMSSAPTHKSPTPGSPERDRPGRSEDRGAANSNNNGTGTAPASGQPTGSNGGPDIVFTRDVTNRQPRSMMACMRCRRQKMKCDGPGKEPCRGCRQAGVPCIFESRARPKSISTLPTRASPLFAGSLPPAGAPGGPGFYPTGAQAAPPITSRPGIMPDYAVRQAQEARAAQQHPQPTMRPPHHGHGHSASITSISSITSATPAPYPPPLRVHSPPVHGQPPIPPQGYYPPPPPGAPGYGPPVAGPPPGGPAPVPPMDPQIDGRLRGLESAFRSVATLPAAVRSIQTTLGSILRAQDALANQLLSGTTASAGISAPRGATADVPEQVWENYRVGAWPLTPWLPGISPLAGLPALVLACLGRRAALERTEAVRREADAAAEAVLAEVSRLLGSRVVWTRDEVLALGVYSTWTNDSAFGVLAVGLARDLQLDRLHTLRKSHDEWREWIYVVLADHMLHIPDFNAPIVQEPISQYWREMISASTPTDPATRDRDGKLLAWLEYSELLIEVQNYQRALRLPGEQPMSPAERDSGSEPSERQAPAGSTDASVERDRERERRERRRSREIWKRYSGRWEAWAGSCGARHDPVLSLHFHYAMLFTASPVFAGSERVWMALTQSHDGYQQLERGRDAAFAVLQSLSSPEIARTLAFSFSVLRPFFGLAIAHLVSLAATLGHTSIISLSHVQSVLRTAADTITSASSEGPRSPGARPNSPSSQPPVGGLGPCLLLEMVETGAIVSVGKRDIVGAEPGSELWRRIIA